MHAKKARTGALSLLSALATLLVVPVAQASVWYGSWDPAYGASFTGLGWRGTATFDVPGNCGAVPSFSGLKNNATDCVGGSFGAAVVTYANVEFYDTALPPGPPPPPAVNSISWGSPPPSFVQISGVTISDLLFENGRLVQLSTNAFPFKFPSPNDVINGNGSVEFALQFVIDLPNPENSEDLYSGPILYDNYPFCEVECPIGAADVFSPGSRPRFTVVPEPTGLALLAGSLLAAGLVARRRRSQMM